LTRDIFLWYSVVRIRRNGTQTGATKMMIMNHPATLYSSKEYADNIALKNNEGDSDGWTYTVKAHGKYFIVEVRDETGEHIATF
jgi:hypothetical protein